MSITRRQNVQECSLRLDYIKIRQCDNFVVISCSSGRYDDHLMGSQLWQSCQHDNLDVSVDMWCRCYCGSWCRGAKVPGHQYPQNWLSHSFRRSKESLADSIDEVDETTGYNGSTRCRKDGVAAEAITLQTVRRPWRVEHIAAETKGPPISWRHFQMHFLEW